MASLDELVQITKDLTTTKYLLTSITALTLYDYLLTVDDEIKYVWRGRKTWIFYLYALNRTLLIGYQFWEIHYLSSSRNSSTECLAGYHIQVLLIMFFLFSSDIFITLRIYAITFGNNILAVYFGTLALARLAMSLATSFIKTPAVVALPPVPLDVFDLCGVVAHLRFKLVPNSLATAFELSAFIVIIWYTYRNMDALRFSTLIRAVVTEATIHFLAMVALQTYVQLSLGLMKGTSQQLSPLAYGLLNPVLTMRFAVSLKRSADPGGRQEWQLRHFSSISFAASPLHAAQTSTPCEDIEIDQIPPRNNQLQINEP